MNFLYCIHFICRQYIDLCLAAPPNIDYFDGHFSMSPLPEPNIRRRRTRTRAGVSANAGSTTNVGPSAPLSEVVKSMIVVKTETARTNDGNAVQTMDNSAITISSDSDTDNVDAAMPVPVPERIKTNPVTVKRAGPLMSKRVTNAKPTMVPRAEPMDTTAESIPLTESALEQYDREMSGILIGGPELDETSSDDSNFSISKSDLIE